MEAQLRACDDQVLTLPAEGSQPALQIPVQGVASLEGWSSGQESILGSVRCGGTGLPQASGLFLSLPFRRAIARLVPSVCGTLPPREGGPHVRLSHRIVHHAMAKQLPLS